MAGGDLSEATLVFIRLGRAFLSLCTENIGRNPTHDKG
jgi:hypothetical protein